jgi:hypothetical protein
MRLFHLDPLGVLAILALLLVLSAPFERERASHAAFPAEVKAHDTSAKTSTQARIQKAVSTANTLH